VTLHGNAPGSLVLRLSLCFTARHMTRRLLPVLTAVSLSVLTSCGGGGSPAVPTTTQPTPKGILTVTVLSAYGSKEATGVKLYLILRFNETAGGSATLTRVEFTVKKDGVAGATYANTDTATIGAKGSLELNYETSEASTAPYPTSLDVTAT
jgi:hypothetical protein